MSDNKYLQMARYPVGCSISFDDLAKELPVNGNPSRNMFYVHSDFGYETPGYGVTAFDDLTAAINAVDTNYTTIIVGPGTASFGGDVEGPDFDMTIVFTAGGSHLFNFAINASITVVGLMGANITSFGDNLTVGSSGGSAKVYLTGIKFGNLTIAPFSRHFLTGVVGEITGNINPANLTVVNSVISIETQPDSPKVFGDIHHSVVNLTNGSTITPMNQTNYIKIGTDVVRYVNPISINDLPAPTNMIGVQIMTTDGGTDGGPAMMGSTGSNWVVAFEDPQSGG